jgi:hypothetical protein
MGVTNEQFQKDKNFVIDFFSQYDWFKTLNTGKDDLGDFIRVFVSNRRLARLALDKIRNRLFTRVKIEYVSGTIF